MIWPTVIVDNFFNEPLKILEISKEVKFSNSEAKYPGVRTECMSLINKEFYNFINYKIIRILYPINHKQIYWKSNQYFQKINGNIYKNEGWIHSDSPAELTAIIYLSNHKNCGTSLYQKKEFFNGTFFQDQKKNMYTNLNIKQGEKYLKQNNEKFENILNINSRFNRLILFDSNQFHAANKFLENGIEEDRLTLITFFYSIHCDGIKYPITEMKRDF